MQSIKPNEASAAASSSAAARVSTWEDDPASGNAPGGGVLVEVPFPVHNAAPFPTAIQSSPPPARDRFPQGTPGFRYWVAADALRRSSNFWGSILGSTAPWFPGRTLKVFLDEGEDLNAFYDRQSLTFFHATIAGHDVHSGESPDVICHEAGHAILDSPLLRPQLWDVASREAEAFHESFGDMSAILVALQRPWVRQAVLTETGGKLYRSSRLSRLAEQLAWGIRQISPDAVEPDCLRNAVNSFSYEPADNLPKTGPASILSSEPHSYSRVFTAAFFEALAGMLASMPKQGEEELLEVSRDMATLLVAAIRAAPIMPAYFTQVGAHLFRAARKQNARYAEAVMNALLRHGLLSIPGAVTVAAAPEPHRITAGLGGNPMPRYLDVSDCGLTVSSIRVEAASTVADFNIAGASRSIGEATIASADRTARAFFEDLLQRGRLDPKTYALPGVSVFDPASFKTHELIDECGTPTLRRRRIDCIPRRVRHV